jgi:hypothetical protein
LGSGSPFKTLAALQALLCRAMRLVPALLAAKLSGFKTSELFPAAPANQSRMLLVAATVSALL